MIRPLTRLVLLAALVLYGTGLSQHAHNVAAHGQRIGGQAASEQGSLCEGNCAQQGDSGPQKPHKGDCPECLMLAANAALWIAPQPAACATAPPSIVRIDHGRDPVRQLLFSPLAPRAPPGAPVGC